jgi:hypothetical protein
VTLAPPDYVILALAAGGVVTGLFIGLSGALAFFSGCLAASFAATFGWRFSASLLSSGLARGLAVALVTLIAFWAVRALVRKTVKVALAQPGDSILGALAAGISGFAVGIGVVWLAQFLGFPGAEGSSLLSEVLSHVG